MIRKLPTLPFRALKRICKPLNIGVAKYPNSRFEYILPHIRNKKTLDIGIVQHDKSKIETDGWLHQFIHDYASDTVGIDIDEEGVQYLKNLGYDTELADATDFDLGQEFEVVVAGELIEHIADFEGFLYSVRSHLSDEGILILTTPNPFFFERFWTLLWGDELPVNSEHTCWFDEQTLNQLLDRYGFTVKETHYTSREWVYRNYRILPRQLRNTTIVVVAKMEPLSDR